MRPYLPGGQLKVRQNITNSFKNLWVTADLYSMAEIEAMDSMAFGQTWTVRFDQRHQCHGAMLMLIHAVTDARRWQQDLDSSLTYAVTPYMESDDGNGGFYEYSYLLNDEELNLMLTVADDRLGTLTLKCDAARALFRQSLYKYLDREDAAVIRTDEVSQYYSTRSQDLYS